MSSVIGACKLEKVWESRLRENYVSITGEVAPSDLPAVVKGLEVHFAKNTPADKLANCDVCNGWSDESLPSCPYCSDGGDPAPKESGIVPAVEATEIDATAIEASGVDLGPEKPGKRKKKSGGVLSTADQKPTEVDAEVPAETESAEKQAKKPKPTSAPSLVLAGGRVIASERELDDEIAKFKAEIQSGSSAYYRAGIHLVKIRDRLWQQRTAEGKPKYKSFEQFCREEFDISKTLAYRIMRVVESFSQEAFQQYGPRTLMILVSAPKEEHAALLARAESGATTRELEAEVKKIRNDKGITVLDPKAGSGKSSPTAKATAAAAESRKKKESAAITAGFKQEQGTIDLLAKPTKKGVDPVPAREIADLPYGTIECMNGVKIYLAVKQKPTGEMQIRYTVRRDDEE